MTDSPEWQAAHGDKHMPPDTSIRRSKSRTNLLQRVGQIGFSHRSLAAGRGVALAEDRGWRDGAIQGLTQRQGRLSVERMCHLAGVSRAGFYRHWQEGQPVVLAAGSVRPGEDGAYADIAEARACIDRFIDEMCNRQRLHSALAYSPPVEFEEKLPPPGPGSRPPSERTAPDGTLNTLHENVPPCSKRPTSLPASPPRPTTPSLRPSPVRPMFPANSRLFGPR